jgi:hypothetical protein
MTRLRMSLAREPTKYLRILRRPGVAPDRVGTAREATVHVQRQICAATAHVGTDAFVRPASAASVGFRGFEQSAHVRASLRDAGARHHVEQPTKNRATPDLWVAPHLSFHFLTPEVTQHPKILTANVFLFPPNCIFNRIHAVRDNLCKTLFRLVTNYSHLRRVTIGREHWFHR